ELHYARIAARQLGTNHHEFIVTPDVCNLIDEIVWHHDEPFADVSSIPTYMVSKMAREHVTVALSGDGGDELFAGYDRYVIDRNREKFELVPGFIRRNVMLPLARALPRAAFGKRFIRNVALEPDARYVDSLSYFNEQNKRELLSPDFIRNIRAHDSS